MIKIYDTSSLLLMDDISLFDKDSLIVITSITLKELERIKTSVNKDANVKYSARQLLRLLDENPEAYTCCIYKPNMNKWIEAYGLEITDDTKLLATACDYIKSLGCPLEDLEFYDIALSLKASSLDLCIESYREAANTIDYPLHLGVTHAGTEFSGTISSSIGLGTLLREGIGNTMRVSLSADPVKEVKVAKEILKDCNLYNESPTLIACPTCGRIQYDLIPIANQIEEFLQTIKSPITVAVMGCRSKWTK